MQCFHRLDREHFPPQVCVEPGENQDKSIDAGFNDTAILPVRFHRIPPPKESMKYSWENRRLLMSILVLAQFAIVLGLQVGKS